MRGCYYNVMEESFSSSVYYEDYYYLVNDSAFYGFVTLSMLFALTIFLVLIS